MLLHDLRFAVRSVRMMRGVAVLAVATLALGIGASTTMFSVAYAALWRAVPFPEPDRLVIVHQTRVTSRDGVVNLRWSRPHLLDLQRAATTFEASGSFTPTIGLALSTTEGYAESIDGEVVSPGYFAVAGVTPRAGRVFLPEEDTVDGAHPVVMLSERLWRRRFNADPALVNGTLRVNDVPLTVVGILPDGFTGLSGRADLWIPTTMAPRLTYSDYLTTPQHFITLVARLKRGVTDEAVNAELATIGSRLGDDGGPPGTTWGATIVRIDQARVDPTLRQSITVLSAAAVCVLLIACVNVASLLLARGRTRAREMAIRIAMGSGRGRLVRQLLAEGAVIAGLAGAAGMLLATWGVRLYADTAPPIVFTGRNTPVASFAAPALDGRALVFAVLVTVVTMFVCALVPALRASRLDPSPALKEDERGGGRHRVALGTLVVVEVAAAVLLLTTAAWLLEGFTRIQQLRAGYEPANVLTFWVRPPNSRYAPTDGPVILERMLTAVQRVPGVISAAVNRCAPFAGCSRTTLRFTDRPNDTPPPVGRHYVSADYFTTLGIPLRTGRLLTDADRAGSAPVTVINDTAARRYWPNESPLGKHVVFGSSTGFTDPARPVEIVGVVGDVKYESVDQPTGPDFYTSYRQFAFPDSMFLVKTAGVPASIEPPLRAAIASVDPTIPVYDVLMLDDRIDKAVAQPRFTTSLVTTGASAAVLLAALGVYGVLSFSVSARRREMAIRLAMGALPAHVVSLILREGLGLAGLGAGLGLAGMLAARRLVPGLVAGSPVPSIWVLTGVLVMVLAVAAVAALAPARRAGRVDPLVVLRNQ